MSETWVDVLLVTEDQQLRELVGQSRPPGARLRCLTAEQYARGAIEPTRQMWFDLDTVQGAAPPETGRRVYFYSGQLPVGPKLPEGVLIRKPCAPPVIAVLWAAVQTEESEAPRATAGRTLPDWLLDFQELNLKVLCRKCVAELAPRLGYRDATLYLYDSRRALLTLAETTHCRAIDLAVPLTAADDHLMVAVARRRRLLRAERVGEHLAAHGIAPHGDRRYPDEACLIAPLVSEGELWGVLNLSGRTPVATEEGLSLEGVFRFLGVALHHARAYDQVRTEARVDSLTALYNQRWITETLEREIRRAQRFHTPLAALMIDLDGLKAVNDREGHAAGDCVLQHVASRISSVLRQFDGAARVGGDEFVVMLPATSLRGAQPVAQRLLQSMAQDPASYHGVPLRITASIGAAEWQPGWDARQLLEAADRAMYQAKQNGRNGMACETPGRPAVVARRGPTEQRDGPARADGWGAAAGGAGLKPLAGDGGFMPLAGETGFKPVPHARGRPPGDPAVVPERTPRAAPPLSSGGERPT